MIHAAGVVIVTDRESIWRISYHNKQSEKECVSLNNFHDRSPRRRVDVGASPRGATLIRYNIAHSHEIRVPASFFFFFFSRLDRFTIRTPREGADIPVWKAFSSSPAVTLQFTFAFTSGSGKNPANTSSRCRKNLLAWKLREGTDNFQKNCCSHTLPASLRKTPILYRCDGYFYRRHREHDMFMELYKLGYSINMSLSYRLLYPEPNYS